MLGHFYIAAFDGHCIQWRENPASGLVAVPIPAKSGSYFEESLVQALGAMT